MAIRQITDEQWQQIRTHIPAKPVTPKGGRPWTDDRRCLNDILWIMWTDAQWAELPKRYPAYTTCWRRLRSWAKDGVFIKMWQAFLSELNSDDGIKWENASSRIEITSHWA